jgi:hypothetical protein
MSNESQSKQRAPQAFTSYEVGSLRLQLAEKCLLSIMANPKWLELNITSTHAQLREIGKRNDADLFAELIKQNFVKDAIDVSTTMVDKLIEDGFIAEYD